MDENMQNSLNDFQNKSEKLINKTNNDINVVFEKIEEEEIKDILGI